MIVLKKYFYKKIIKYTNMKILYNVFLPMIKIITVGIIISNKVEKTPLFFNITFLQSNVFN